MPKLFKKNLVIFFCCLQTLMLAQATRVISGQVSNASNNEPLAFATVALKKQLIGILTNEEGKFDLYIPESLKSDTLLISYLGYKPKLIEISTISGPLAIKLQSSAIELKEIVIRPMPPEHYIRLAMRRLKENYAAVPFETNAYYREKVLENKNLVKCDEGIFKTYYPNYLDTVRNQDQLMLFRRAENIQQVTFMSEEKKKKEDREAARQKKKEAKGKKGEEKKSEKKDDIEIDLGSSFGGPQTILRSSNLARKSEGFLDSLKFKDYEYSFAKSSTYNNTEIMVIDFKTKGRVDHLRESGKVYLDMANYSIIKFESSGVFDIPAIIKPILFLYGLGIDDPLYTKHVEFQLINGRWYPKDIHYYVDLKLTRRHWFKSNEHSDFEIEQVFAVNKSKIENTTPIPQEKRFVASKDMKTQIYNDEGLSWEGLNIIKK
jgi:hypothetical protein